MPIKLSHNKHLARHTDYTTLLLLKATCKTYFLAGSVSSDLGLAKPAPECLDLSVLIFVRHCNVA